MSDQGGPGGSAPRVLVVTGGHPFDRDAFTAVFDDIAADRWTHAEQPAAADLLHPEACAAFDVIVFYDMAGLRFTRGDPPLVMTEPGPALQAGMAALLDQGTGMVFLHHAVAGWPAWPEYARIVGGRFHYQPAVLEGVAYPDSGYRFDVTHRVEVLDPTHPICAGLGGGFEITDELYMFPVLTGSVVPLLRTTYDVGDATLFYSADHAIRGTRDSIEGWSHPPGSDRVGWVKHAGNAPVVYLQFGDGPQTYADPHYRRVLSNAVAWAAGDEARTWARQHADADRG